MCPSVKRISDSIAAEYNYQIGYAKNAVVMLKGTRLKALVDIPAGTPYDESKWTKARVQEDVGGGGGGGGFKPVVSGEEIQFIQL